MASERWPELPPHWAFVGRLAYGASDAFCTAFLISEEIALTAGHAIDEASQGTLVLPLLSMDIPVAVVHVDLHADFAVLHLAKPAPVTPIPVLSRFADGGLPGLGPGTPPPGLGLDGAHWQSAWMTREHPTGIITEGKVIGLISIPYLEDRPTSVFELAVEVGPKDSSGCSGAPLVVDSRVVGIFVAGQRGESRGDVLYARPISAVFESTYGSRFDPGRPTESDLKPPADELVRLEGRAFSQAADRVLALAAGLADRSKPASSQIDSVLLLGGVLQHARERRDTSAVFLQATVRPAATGRRAASPLITLGIADRYGIQKPTLAVAGRVTPDRLSPELLSLLDRAQAFAERTTSGRGISLRHLLAALVARTRSDETPPLAVQFLTEQQTDVEALRANLLSMILRDRPQDSALIWRELLAPAAVAPGQCQTDYDSDATDTADLLNIRDDVDAFATLIASKNVAPPLSIGLFGHWGCGKTFFMRRLQERIRTLSAAARASGQPQREIDYYKHIVQIDFNAWQYIEGDLWASLLTHIFDNLREDPDEDLTLVGRRQKYLLRLIDEKQQKMQAAEQGEAQITTRIREKECEIADIDRQIEDTKGKLDGPLKELASLAKEIVFEDLSLGPNDSAEIRHILEQAGRQVGEAVSKAADLDRALGEARSSIERAGSVLGPLLQAKDSRRRWLHLLLIAIAVPGLLAALVAWLAGRADPGSLLARVGPMLTAVVGWMGLGSDWIRRQVGWTSKWLDRVEAGQRRIQQRFDAETADLRKRRGELEEQIAALQRDHAELDAKRLVATQEVSALNQDLERTTPAFMLTQFIDERAASADYRARLGLPALIRRDLETLSDAIRQYNDDLEKKGDVRAGAAEEESINRIVLYIDDLDRCEVKRVVKVLQAVHLLLSFPLFAVVVAVDARWVSQSLRAHYRRLLTAPRQGGLDSQFGRYATPYDYLEKIFQIPFWLGTMGESGGCRMIDGLTEKARERARRARLEAKPPSPDRAAAGVTTVEPVASSQEKPPPEEGKEPQMVGPEAQAQPGPEQTGATPAGQEGEPATPKPADSESRQPADLKPRSLEISDEEHQFMRALTPLLWRSPRVLKRFVNLYRLAKARAASAGDGVFLADKGPSSNLKAAMFLLGVVTGLPELSPSFLETLRQLHAENAKPAGQSSTPYLLGCVLKKLREQGGDSEELARLDEWVARAEGGEWAKASLRLLAEEASHAARYSFPVESLEASDSSVGAP